jgi:hypothetical protein
LELCEAGIIKRLMIFIPPQYGKSELVSRSFPAWYLGRNPEKQIILASYGETLAFNLATDARNKVMDPAYRALFGDLSPHESPVAISRNSKSVREWRLNNGKGRMKSAGVGGGITGHPADLLIIDDPVKDMDEADSPTMQEKVINWFSSSAYTRLSPDGVIILCMTRWNEKDLAGYLLSNQSEEGEEWYVLRLPAMAESLEDMTSWARRNHVPPERMLSADRLVSLVA